MFGIFELIDERWGINKVEQTLKENNFDGKVKNKLDWLVRNTMKVLLVFCSIAAFWLGFVSIAGFIAQNSAGHLMFGFICVAFHAITLWLFRFLCMLERV